MQTAIKANHLEPIDWASAESAIDLCSPSTHVIPPRPALLISRRRLKKLLRKELLLVHKQLSDIKTDAWWIGATCALAGALCMATMIRFFLK